MRVSAVVYQGRCHIELFATVSYTLNLRPRKHRLRKLGRRWAPPLRVPPVARVGAQLRKVLLLPPLLREVKLEEGDGVVDVDHLRALVGVAARVDERPLAKGHEMHARGETRQLDALPQVDGVVAHTLIVAAGKDDRGKDGVAANVAGAHAAVQPFQQLPRDGRADP